MISKSTFYYITFFLFQLPLWLFAQSPFQQNTTQANQQHQVAFDDSTTKWQPFKVQEVKYATGINGNEYVLIDTSLHNFQVYDPALQADFNFRTIGNIGLAAYPVFFQPYNNFGFDLGYNAFDLYRLNRNNIRKYKTPTPFTEFNLMIGPKREQLVNVYHSQTIKNRFSFNFEYNRVAGTGIFRNQRSANNNFAVNTYYITKKQRYSIGALFVYDNVSATENGGLGVNGILYKDTTFLNKEIVPVRLANAQTEMRDRDISINQQLAFGKTITRQLNDTISVTELAPIFKVYHTLGYGSNKLNYIDRNPDTLFYGNFFERNANDILAQNDSVFNAVSHRQFYNTAGIILQFVDSYDSSEVKYKNFFIDLNLTHSIHTIKSHNQKFNLQNLNFVGLMSNHPTSKSNFIYSGKAALSFVSYNAGDLLLEAKAGYRFGKAGIMEAVVTQQLYQPSWMLQNFIIRDLSWNNNFRKTNQFSLGFDYTLAKYHVLVSGRLYNITNLTYFDETFLPQQFNGNTQGWMLSAMKNFNLKGFGLDNMVRLQFFSGSDFVRMPQTWLRHSAFVEGKLFKGALQSRFGIDMTYNANYFANGYFPLTGQFFVQNTEVTKFYPVFDVWFSFKIKTFRIFLKVDHVNEGLFKQSNYYNFYDFPGMQRAFRIGLSWRFYD